MPSPLKAWQGRFLMGQVNDIDVAQGADDLVLSPPLALPVPEPRRMSFVASLVASRQHGSQGRS
jgi:hypothetical protein